MPFAVQVRRICHDPYLASLEFTTFAIGSVESEAKQECHKGSNYKDRDQACGDNDRDRDAA